MRKFYPFPEIDTADFVSKILHLSETVEHFCYLGSNNYPNYPHSAFGSLFAIDAVAVISVNKDCLDTLAQFRNQHNDWIFGFLSYDLKDEIETLPLIEKEDKIKNDLLYFFVPKYIVKIENNNIEIGVVNENDFDAFKSLINQHQTSNQKPEIRNQDLKIQQSISKETYLQTIEKIKTHIQRGDIYEMNFCQEFFVENIEINPLAVFQNFNERSKAPFTAFLKNKHQYLLCASPERFLKRQHNTIIAQPIKGTRKRHHDKTKDEALRAELLASEKERGENVMIVDLVRNDMSRIAKHNSVKVEELFGIYSFKQVHQMISTITCEIASETTFTEIIKNLFPMGSMTGAPKISAMQLIDKLEISKRGLYSGAVGYITPKGNFDFNVVIRSILYNRKRKMVSMQAGSAITIDSDAEKEYEECLLKANAMFEALKNTNPD